MIPCRAPWLVGAPLIPGGDEAREWAERELADPVYREAEPTFFDRMARAVADFLASLFSAEVDGSLGLVLAVVATGVILVLIVIAFVIWGVPRSTRRARPPRDSLFGDSDERSADELRAASASAAARGEWGEAIVLRFRALARGLGERGIVETPPGATVHAFARAAALAYPSSADALESSATAFDDVRYLRRPGTADLYELVTEVDQAIAVTTPAQASRTPVGASA